MSKPDLTRCPLLIRPTDGMRSVFRNQIRCKASRGGHTGLRERPLSTSAIFGCRSTPMRSGRGTLPIWCRFP